MGSGARRGGRLRRALAGAAWALVSAAALGLVATRVLAARAERAFPATGRRVPVDGLRQHVIERGSGPDVLLVHGAFGTAEDFAATVLDELAARFHVVAWDRPGHGYSERSPDRAAPARQARLLLDVARALELSRPVLVGFSFGGAVCLGAALEAPGEVAGLVLVNTPTHPWPDPIELAYRAPLVPVLGRLATETVLPPFALLRSGAGVVRAFAPEPPTASFERSPLALALRPASLRANAEDVCALKPFLAQLAPRYGELDLPVLYLSSAADRVVSPTHHAPALAAQAPDCEVVRVPGAGHQLLYTRPELVADAVQRLVARAASGP